MKYRLRVCSRRRSTRYQGKLFAPSPLYRMKENRNKGNRNKGNGNKGNRNSKANYMTERMKEFELIKIRNLF